MSRLLAAAKDNLQAELECHVQRKVDSGLCTCQVFERFVHWKALVEKSSGMKLKSLRTYNGREFTSHQFILAAKTDL